MREIALQAARVAEALRDLHIDLPQKHKGTISEERSDNIFGINVSENPRAVAEALARLKAKAQVKKLRKLEGEDCREKTPV